MNYEEFAEKLLSSPGGYEIVETKRGVTHTYRGRDVSAFIARGDHRQHEHKVTDSGGNLVYHRDANGVVRIGTSGQFLAAKKARSAGSVALWGLRGKPDNPVQDIVRNGIRLGLGIKKKR